MDSTTRRVDRIEELFGRSALYQAPCASCGGIGELGPIRFIDSDDPSPLECSACGMRPRLVIVIERSQ
jgi:hypothetical protein